jgi:hypothetical protein
MNDPKRSTFEIDLALLGAADCSDWSQADRVRLERARAKDAEFLRLHPRLDRGRVSRFGYRAPKTLLLASMAAAIGLAIMVLSRPDENAIRAKGSSAVTMYVKRGDAIEPYRGDVLHRGDMLVFRYSTTRHRLVLAGMEESGEISIDAPIQPGDERVFPTGVELDDYVGSEVVVAIFSDEPVESSELQEYLRGVASSKPPKVAFDHAAWRIVKQDRN